MYAGDTHQQKQTRFCLKELISLNTQQTAHLG